MIVSLTCSIPTLATAVVPEGTPMQYTQYQSIVNGRVFESAQANAENDASRSSGRIGGIYGITAAAVGIAAGMGLVAWI